jgi:hypothetical protein
MEINIYVTLETNEYGQQLSTVTIGYGRQQSLVALTDSFLSDKDIKKQTSRHMLHTATLYTKPVLQSTAQGAKYRTPARCETRSYEINGISPDGQLFGVAELKRKLMSLPDIPSENWNSSSELQSRRLIHDSIVICPSGSKDRSVYVMTTISWPSRRAYSRRFLLKPGRSLNPPFQHSCKKAATHKLRVVMAGGYLLARPSFPQLASAHRMSLLKPEDGFL